MKQMKVGNRWLIIYSATLRLSFYFNDIQNINISMINDIYVYHGGDMNNVIVLFAYIF